MLPFIKHSITILIDYIKITHPILKDALSQFLDLEECVNRHFPYSYKFLISLIRCIAP